MERVHIRDPLATLTKKQIAKKLNTTGWTIMRWVSLGKFPEPIRLSEHTLVWRVRDVEAWLREREVDPNPPMKGNATKTAE